MTTNIIKKIKGPALVTYKGATFYAKGDVSLTSDLSTFAVDTDAFGEVDQRNDDFQFSVSFTPAGDWADIAVLFPYATKSLNDFLADTHFLASATNASNQLGKTAHGIANGTPVRILSRGGAIPAGLSESTLYYTYAVNVDTLTLHAVLADSATGASPAAFTDDGTGTLILAEQQPLVVHSLSGDGERITLHNAVVEQMPAIQFGATKTLFGEVTFGAYQKYGAAWSDANSRYTIDSAAVPASSFNPASLVTQPYLLSWGAAPWADLATQEGVEMSFDMQLTNDQTDADGTAMKSLSNLAVTVTAQPIGPTLTNLTDKLAIQGGSAARGASRSGDDLNVVGTGVYARLYNASLQTAPLAWSRTNNRIGQLQWRANRSFSGGAPVPLFYLGTSAPA